MKSRLIVYTLILLVALNLFSCGSKDKDAGNNFQTQPKDYKVLTLSIRKAKVNVDFPCNNTRTADHRNTAKD